MRVTPEGGPQIGGGGDSRQVLRSPPLKHTIAVDHEVFQVLLGLLLPRPSPEEKWV